MLALDERVLLHDIELESMGPRVALQLIRIKPPQAARPVEPLPTRGNAQELVSLSRAENLHERLENARIEISKHHGHVVGQLRIEPTRQRAGQIVMLKGRMQHRQAGAELASTLQPSQQIQFALAGTGIGKVNEDGCDRESALFR